MSTIQGEVVSARLARRHRDAAIVSRMMLECILLLHSTHPRRKSPGAVIEDLMVAMAVRENDDDGGKPYTIAGIAKRLNMPRSNVSRAVKWLVGLGLIRSSGDGERTYVGELKFLQARIDAPYFKKIRTAIFVAARELKKSK
jgi:DNA-binding transcriptional ArsR family regulator